MWRRFLCWMGWHEWESDGMYGVIDKCKYCDEKDDTWL